MNFFKTLFKQKEKPVIIETETLIEWMDHNSIIYEYKESDDGYVLTYFDALDNAKYRIEYNGKSYVLNGCKQKEDSIKQILEEQQKKDLVMESYILNPNNEVFMQIGEFCKALFSDKVFLFDININAKDELELSYSPPDGERFLLLKMKKKDKKIYANKSSKGLNDTKALLWVVDFLLNKHSLIFDSDGLSYPENNKYSDTIKEHIVNKTLVERLNGIKNVEAKLITSENTSNIFVIFKNGAALEYKSPTKQIPKGQFVILDVDEDATVEDNEEFWLSQKILKIPDMISDKPNKQI